MGGGGGGQERGMAGDRAEGRAGPGCSALDTRGHALAHIAGIEIFSPTRSIYLSLYLSIFLSFFHMYMFLSLSLYVTHTCTYAHTQAI